MPAAWEAIATVLNSVNRSAGMVEAYVGDRWYTFDATQTTPKGGRVVLAYGRDAADVAFISNYGTLETIAMRVWVERAAAPSPLPPAPPMVQGGGAAS